VIRRGYPWPLRTGAAAVALGAALLLPTRMASAEERYALIVSGAAGGANYAEQYAQWTESLSSTLLNRMKLDPAHVVTLSDTADPLKSATAVNVRRVLDGLRRQTTSGDLLFLVLIGHGTFDGAAAKFNLVGPDLDAADWAALLRAIPARVVAVNTASASFPFLERFAGPRRVVISSTDSAAQRFDTVFPEYFVRAFEGDEADIDKNGRISMWEAFAAASAGVRRHYQQRGQLSTERALLDDNGDGLGREAAAQGADGPLASRTYLDAPAAGASPTDEVLVELLQRRASLLAEVEELQIKKAFLAPDEYAREFERVMLELARVGRLIRGRVKT
jgi:hypothetical protein